jgi:hypothetical protein
MQVLTLHGNEPAVFDRDADAESPSLLIDGILERPTVVIPPDYIQQMFNRSESDTDVWKLPESTPSQHALCN